MSALLLRHDTHAGWVVLKFLAIALGIGVVALFWGLAVAIMPIYAVILVTAIVTSLVIVWDFRLGAVLLLAIMPISATRVFPHQMFGVTGFNPLNMLLVASLGAYLARNMFERKKTLPGSRELLWFFVLPILAGGVIGALHVRGMPTFMEQGKFVQFHERFGYLRDVVIRPLFYVLFALLIAAAVRQSCRAERFLVPWIVSAALFSGLVLLYFALSGISLTRLASPSARLFLTPLGMHANEWGIAFASAFIMLLFSLVRGSRAYQIFAAPVLLALAIGIVITFSRAAFLMVVIGVIWLLLSRRRMKTVIFGALMAVMVVAILPRAVTERVSAGLTGGGPQVHKASEEFTAGRVAGLWLPMLPEVLRNPVIGSGLSSILWSAPLRKGQIIPVIHPHNAYLRTLLDVGLVGLVCFGLFWRHIYLEFRTLGRDPTLAPQLGGFFEGAAVGLVAFLVAAFTNSGFVPGYEHCFLWAAIGLMYGCRKQREDAHSSTQSSGHAAKATVALAAPTDRAYAHAR